MGKYFLFWDSFGDENRNFYAVDILANSSNLGYGGTDSLEYLLHALFGAIIS